MKFLISVSFALAFALGTFTSQAFAEEVLLNTGSGIEGEIEKIDHLSLTVKSADGKSLKLLRGAVDSHFYYTAWNKRVEKTAEAHLRLGVFAFENGLFNQARSQYRKAQSLDKALVEKFEREIVPQIKEGIAAKLLAMAQAAVKEKRIHKAETIARKLLTRLDDTKAAEEARRLIADVHLWEVDADQERLVKRLSRYLPKDAKASLKTRERVSSRAAPIERKIEKSRRLKTRALRTKSANRQKGIFEQAAKQFESQVSSIDKLMETAADDEALMAYLGGLREIAVREGVDAWIDAGNVNMVRSSFPNALKQGNRALALDPDSAKAKKFVAEVTESASHNNLFWGRGGGGRRRESPRRSRANPGDAHAQVLDPCSRARALRCVRRPSADPEAAVHEGRARRHVSRPRAWPRQGGACSLPAW
jgi:tetratricopeptide (TPR) repeat protein